MHPKFCLPRDGSLVLALKITVGKINNQVGILLGVLPSVENDPKLSG